MVSAQIPGGEPRGKEQRVKSFLQGKQRELSLVMIALILTFAAGCATRHAYLVPAPTDHLTDARHAATASADYVSITVVPDDWNGRPHNLYKRVTPLKARIENHGKEPIRLVYRDFDVQTPQGNLLAALPPSQIRGTQYVGENQVPSDPPLKNTARQDPDRDRDHDQDVDGGPTVIVTPGFDSDDFYYAPYWDYGYVGIGPWPNAWAPDWGYYNSYYPYMRRIHLPTRSMLRKGIPEGVIAPGGYVEGFLFFTKVNPDLKNVEFIAKLQNADTGKQFGTVKIAFEVKGKG